MKVAVVFIFVALFVAKSFTLECFVCDSDFDHNCHNMYDRNVRTENCDDARMVGYQRSVCLKTVTFEYGNRKTSRSCARAGPRKDPCLERRNALDLSVCEICDHHLCNGSIATKTSIWATILFSSFIFIKKFI